MIFSSDTHTHKNVCAHEYWTEESVNERAGEMWKVEVNKAKPNKQLLHTGKKTTPVRMEKNTQEKINNFAGGAATDVCEMHTLGSRSV